MGIYTMKDFTSFLPSITFSSPKCVRGRKLGVSSAWGVMGLVGDCMLVVTLILTSWWAWAPALDEVVSLFMFAAGCSCSVQQEPRDAFLGVCRKLHLEVIFSVFFT